MKNTSIFQTILLGASVVLLIGGIVAFAVLGGKFRSGSSVGTVVIWGTQPAGAIQGAINSLRSADHAFEDVKYIEKDPATYESDLVDAIASGQGPDLFLLPERDVLSLRDKVQVIPYSVESQSDYDNAFIDEAQFFLAQNGMSALPLTVDPLVMYWNRDLLASGGVANPPQYWSDLIPMAPALTHLDQSSGVGQSAVALGLWDNVHDAKALLSALIMQAGDPMVVVRPSGPAPVFGAASVSSHDSFPAESALRFYTDFANPSKTVYSWNRSLPDSENAFIAGKLAIYFGFASEYADIASRNPNLHFSVSLLPQVRGQQAAMTYGDMQGLSIPRGARNPQGAALIARKLSSAAGERLVVQNLNLPPVRRDLIAGDANQAAVQVFMQSALIARGWLDPDPETTDSLFKKMVESVVSGASTPADAVREASQQFSQLFPQSIAPSSQ